SVSTPYTLGRPSGVRSSPLISRRSAPEEKARPAPVMRTARTASFSLTWARAASRSSPSCLFHALSASGRFSSIVAAPSSSIRLTVSRRIVRGVYGVGHEEACDRDMHRARACSLGHVGPGGGPALAQLRRGGSKRGRARLDAGA